MEQRRRPTTLSVVGEYWLLAAVVLRPERGHDEAGEGEAGDGGQEGSQDWQVQLSDQQVGHQAGTDRQEGVEAGEEGHGAGHQAPLQSPGVVLTHVPGAGRGVRESVRGGLDSPRLEY